MRCALCGRCEALARCTGQEASPSGPARDKNDASDSGPRRRGDAQIGHAEAAAAAASDGAAAREAAPPRFAGALDWCAGLDALLAGLGGVALEAAPAGELRLRLAVHADAAWAPEPGACSP